MNRPFAFLGFSYLFGLIVAFFGTLLFGIVLAVCSVIAFVVILIKKIDNAELKICLFGFAVSIFTLLLFNTIYITEFEDYYGKEVNAKMTLYDVISHSDSTTTYSAVVHEIDGEDVRDFSIKLNSSIAFLYDYGDVLQVNIAFSENENETGFSLQNSMIADGYVHFARASLYEGYSMTESQNSILHIPSFIKNLTISKVDELYMDDIADFLIAMLVGDNSRLSDEVYEDFRLAGVSHVIVVSGMHLSIIFTSLFMLFKKIRIPWYVSYLILIPMIITYVMICGMGKSVLRSGVMMILLLVGNSLGEETDGLNSLGFSCLLLCLFNPYSAVDIGFLLSIAATGGIIYLSPILFDKIKITKLEKGSKLLEKGIKFINGIFNVICVSVCAFLFVTPILVFAFGTINPLSILSSTILALPASVFLSVGIITVVLGFVPILGELVIIPMIIVNLMGKFILFFCSIMAEVGAKLWVLPENRSIILFVGFCFVLAITFLFKPSLTVKVTALICTAVIIFSAYYSTWIQFQTPRVIIADISGGNLVMIKQGDACAILTASGYSSYTVKSIFTEYNIDKITYLNVDVNDPSNAESFIMDNYEVENFLEGSEVRMTDDILINPLIENKLIEVKIGDKSLVLDSVPLNITDISSDVAVLTSGNSTVRGDIVFASNLAVDELATGSIVFPINDSYYSLLIDNEIKIRSMD